MAAHVRKLYYWKLNKREIQLGERTVLMGVLNLTPDSFSDGGKYSEPDRAFARALEIEDQGADILDIGAESTKPGAAPISAAEEIRRLIPVLKRLKDRLSIPISVDTYKAEIAERALDLGVEIINDPSGLTIEPHMARVVSNHNAGLVLNHMRQTQGAEFLLSRQAGAVGGARSAGHGRAFAEKVPGPRINGGDSLCHGGCRSSLRARRRSHRPRA